MRIGIGAAAALLIGTIVLLSVVLGTTESTIARDLHHQCDSAVGPDPALSVSPTSVRRTPTTRETLTSPPPTNPYASLTARAGDPRLSQWQRDCLDAVPSAPYQLPALWNSTSGPGVECARQLATAQVGSRVVDGAGGLDGPDGDAFDPAIMTRYVTYLAELAAGTGACAQSAAPPTVRRSACAPLLPAAIAEQGVCGQRVEPSAASPGDLVFWDYRNVLPYANGNRRAPTRVGIIVAVDEIVTADLVTGRFIRKPFPDAGDARVKRVIGMGSGGRRGRRRVAPPGDRSRLITGELMTKSLDVVHSMFFR